MRLKQLLPPTASQEPIGIVIADGGRAPMAPRFSAFVWGPVPDDEQALVRDPQELVAVHS